MEFVQSYMDVHLVFINDLRPPPSIFKRFLASSSKLLAMYDFLKNFVIALQIENNCSDFLLSNKF